MKHWILAVMAIALVGCGSSDAPKESVEDRVEVNPIAVFQDEYDIDNYMFVDLAFKAHNLGLATVKLVDKSGLNGRDNGTIWFDAIAKDNNITVPIGMNQQTYMRATFPKAMTFNPPQGDGIPDSHRKDTVEIMCEELPKLKGKIKIVSGGHVHSLSNFLNETDRCNGKQLMAEKVSHVICTLGGFASAETNFSEGVTKPEGDVAQASIAARNLVNNLPNEVKLVLHSVPKYRAVGDLYEGRPTAMGHLLSVKVYGETYGTVGQGDNLSMAYGLFGTNIGGDEYVREENVCFETNTYNGAVYVKPACGKNHFVLHHDNHTADVIAQQFRGMIVNGGR